MISLDTTSSIYSKQNDPRMKKCLVAQRDLYRKARKKSLIIDYAMLCFALLSIIASYINEEFMDALVFLFFTIISVCRNHLQDNFIILKREAAYIQDYFDVTLYKYVLNDSDINWETKISDYRIDEYVCEVDEKDLDSMQNWYNDYSNLTPVQQIFCCQRENLRWDSKLRISYRNLILFIVACLIFVMVFVTLISNPKIIDFICVFSWILPLVEFGYNYCRKLNFDVKKLQEIKDLTEKNTIENITIEKLKIFQDCITDLRKKSSFVPEWYYNIKKKKYSKFERDLTNEIKQR